MSMNASHATPQANLSCLWSTPRARAEGGSSPEALRAFRREYQQLHATRTPRWQELKALLAKQREVR